MTDWDPANQVRCNRQHRSDRSTQTGQTGLIRGRVKPSSRKEYYVKEWKEELKITVDTEKLKANDVVQIGDVKVTTKDMGKGPMVFGKSVDTPMQRPVIANDHEASSSSSNAVDKYHQPRWCPPGLTQTQKWKLQRLHNKEKKEQEAEKMRDEHFNKSID